VNSLRGQRGVGNDLNQGKKSQKSQKVRKFKEKSASGRKNPNKNQWGESNENSPLVIICIVFI